MFGRRALPPSAARHLAVAKFHNNLATALMHGGRGDEAVAEFRRALELVPDLAEVHYNLAGLLADRGAVDAL